MMSKLSFLRLILIISFAISNSSLQGNPNPKNIYKQAANTHSAEHLLTVSQLPAPFLSKSPAFLYSTSSELDFILFFNALFHFHSKWIG